MRGIPMDNEPYRQILTSYICDAKRKMEVSDMFSELQLAKSELYMFLGMYKIKFGITYDEYQRMLHDKTLRIV